MIDLDERFYLLAMHRVFFQHPRVAWHIYNEAGSAKSAFQGDRSRLRPIFGGLERLWRTFSSFDDWSEVQRYHEKIIKLGFDVALVSDDDYPPLLRHVYDPPLVLIIRGKKRHLFSVPSVAIVGARKASENARRLAVEIASDLAGKGFCVVSGMAYGVDAAAHLGALHAEGSTIAVLGCGADITYPSAHRGLASKIEEAGLILSEFPLGTNPFPAFFPQRNRIISGISLAVVVVEAAERSGSLITARLALEEGRDVFACPGAGGHTMSAGSNKLLHDGALLVERGEDVVPLVELELKNWPCLKLPGHFCDDVALGDPLLGLIPKKGDVSADELVARSGRSVADVLSVLTKLMLFGYIEETPGRRFKLKEKR